jgi:hypothetical protein
MSHAARLDGPLPAGAVGLGVAGLLPFVAAAGAMALAPPDWRGVAATALAAYAALIASFLGGIHWGLAFARPRPQTTLWAWGVTPSLLAWMALLLPRAAGLACLAATLVACLVVDRRVYPRLGLAPWLALRWPLTVVAAGSCAVGAVLA